MNKAGIVCMILLTGSCLVVFAVEGLNDLTWINIFPLMLAGLAVALGTTNGRMSWPNLAFAAVTAFMIVLTHLAWEFDWGQTASGSSTLALIFIFSPIYSLLLGVCAGAIAMAAIRFSGNRRPNVT